jgi:anti-sigma factor ChrR (cupin superfamily)
LFSKRKPKSYKRGILIQLRWKDKGGKVDEVMIDTVKNDAAAQNGYSNPQIWKQEPGEITPSGSGW